MKIKSLILNATFLFVMHAGYSQDTSGLSKNNKLLADTVAPASQRAKHKTRNRINSNTGTSIPTTTSGTLSSSVNPNTQLVIPISKNKKKKQ